MYAGPHRSEWSTLFASVPRIEPRFPAGRLVASVLGDEKGNRHRYRQHRRRDHNVPHTPASLDDTIECDASMDQRPPRINRRLNSRLAVRRWIARHMARFRSRSSLIGRSSFDLVKEIDYVHYRNSVPARLACFPRLT